jgi:DNA-binding MarR family transcriptional regulator
VLTGNETMMRHWTRATSLAYHFDCGLIWGQSVMVASSPRWPKMSASPQNDNNPAARNERLASLHSGMLSLVRTGEPDLTMRQLGVLLICATARHPETVKSLAMRMHIAKPIITRAIDRLEELGLARRLPDPFDGRSVLIEVTRTGYTLCRSFASVAKVG